MARLKEVSLDEVYVLRERIIQDGMQHDDWISLAAAVQYYLGEPPNHARAFVAKSGHAVLRVIAGSIEVDVILSPKIWSHLSNIP